ncbi:hypothetical protein B0H15DRAFT_471398 [Mycena belliarum]|uniref:Uncharacterized protein n=1 Tax=Mycena belliarum TaxID=1033014 RepID=A0AAD6TVE8_9AGAR|nr:hypothetical protein B0H15DRAFT_471398 [Mycena belliae]
MSSLSPPRPRRNAVDYGSGGNYPFAYPIITPRTHPVLYREPTLLPDPTLPPSGHQLHYYALLGLRRMPSGNVPRPPPPENCAECKADALIDTVRERFAHPVPVVPERHFRGPAPGIVNHIAIGSSAPDGVRRVLVNDVLEFRDGCLAIRPGCEIVRHPPGPLRITLRIEGHPPVDDIIYATCAHRDITSFNFLWWVAYHLRTLAKFSFNADPDKLELRCLHSHDGSSWIAYAGFRN